ncbi:M60 family metallopeptidase [Bacteroides sp.]|uniref:M60 family metallopeptidase n=1 Tax=Bacteroides sp. TaxID=29523 RepID=UPI002FCB3079
MKKYLLLILITLLPMYLLVACSEDEKLLVSNLTVSKEIVDFNNTAGEQEIAVTTNVDDWVFKSDKAWCRPFANGQTLKISVDESDERLVREATITITAANQTKAVKVRQLGYEPAILVDKQLFSAEAIGGDIQLSITTNVKVDVKLPEWITTAPATRAPEMITTAHTYSVKPTTLDNQRQEYIKITEVLPELPGPSSNKPLEVLVSVTQKGLNQYEGGTGEDIKGDNKIKVISGAASSFQAGSDIDKSFDGDYTTIYHSNWNNTGANYFPIQLTYNFEAATDVDYLIYYPRNSGNNGLFKEVEIQSSIDGVTFTKVMDKDLQGASVASRVMFDQTIHAKSFRFIVKNGAGDGQGFASCAEMEFYAKNPDSFDYKTLFTDATCSELKQGVTEENINECQYPFFKNIAYYMLKGKYAREFRIDQFRAYPHPDIQSKTHKTNAYSLLDNPTGISVKANEALVVLVGDTHGKNIALKVQNLDVPGGDGFGGITYPLNQGVNKLIMREKGLVYVMYHTSTLDDVSAAPIKIHFASGTVSGYFDSEKHQGRWVELINKATDRYFDVLGKYAHLTFETTDLKSYAGSNGDKLIAAYDKIAYSQQQLLGLEKYDKMFKNRMYLNVMYHSYMYATSYHTAYHKSTMNAIADVGNLQTNACWGPAHEIGHCNQTRPGLKWLGTTEVTNNIMSEYIQTTILKQDSRIQVEDMGVNYRNRYSKAWSSIIADKRAHSLSDDVFCKLVPFWQLELYLGKVLGRTPLVQADKGGFYPDVYEYIRTHDDLKTPAAQQTEFVYICSKLSGYNLLDFFEKWGFLTPVDVEIDDYGIGRMTVTQARIDEMKQRVNALGLPKPDVALEYISDNTWELYKQKPAIARGTASRSGDKLMINGWKNVVVYEVVDTETRQLKFASSGETTPSDNDFFTLPFTWKETYKVYAVAVDGTRVEVVL